VVLIAAGSRDWAKAALAVASAITTKPIRDFMAFSRERETARRSRRANI
jgi:hypothetical protein